MRERLLTIAFGLLASLIFGAEIYGMGLLGLWLLSFEAWWVWPLLFLLLIGSMAAMFFLLWMLSIAFWEAMDILHKKNDIQLMDKK